MYEHLVAVRHSAVEEVYAQTGDRALPFAEGACVEYGVFIFAGAFRRAAHALSALRASAFTLAEKLGHILLLGVRFGQLVNEGYEFIIVRAYFFVYVLIAEGDVRVSHAGCRIHIVDRKGEVPVLPAEQRLVAGAYDRLDVLFRREGDVQRILDLDRDLYIELALFASFGTVG